jgi:diguanylate cyclase (GGDEF)-like protein
MAALPCENIPDGKHDVRWSDGVLNLSGYDFAGDDPVRLDGPWDFRWNRLLDPGNPEWDALPGEHGYQAVPGSWTAYPKLGLPVSGFASYRLRVKIPDGMKGLAIQTPEIFTEYRLWINGVLIDGNGVIPGAKIKFLRPGLFSFRAESSDLDVVLQVKNNAHANAGISQSLWIGSGKKLFRDYINAIALDIFLIAICLFAGLYHAILYLFRRSERALLYFGLFCVIIAVRTFTTGTTLISQLFPNIGFATGSRIATAVIPLATVAFLFFVWKVFDFGERKIVPHIIATPSLLYLALVLVAPTLVYTTVYSYYLAIILVTFGYTIFLAIQALVRRIPYSRVFAINLSILFVGLANDMLHYLQIIDTGYYFALFFSAFILTETLIMSIRFSTEHRMVLELSEKLTAMDRLKDEFLANTSHELRTPLNGIIGVAESLVDGVTGDLPDATIRNLNMIVASGYRLSGLVNDILDFSKLKNNDIELKKTAVDLRQLTAVVMTVTRMNLAGKPVELINDIAADAPLVDGDENRLQQILYNLIGNGVKFTARGYVRVSSSIRDGLTEVCVEDTGIGIPKDRQDAVFRSFEQADGSIAREYGGTGLGLSITKKLVELHSGSIRVESEPEHGSRFIFTIPETNQNSSGPTLRTKSIMDGAINPSTTLPVGLNRTEQGPGAKILVVDDDPLNVQVLLNFLSLRRFRSDFANDGYAALDKIKVEAYDLVLLDIMMPRMSGYDVCRKIRERFSLYELPVILLTAKNQSKDIMTAFEVGANDYLLKPLDQTELFVRMGTQLALRQAVRDAMTNSLLANTDQLTGLNSRRFFINSGSREFETAKKRNEQLSAIMLDVDDFKNINDDYGHEKGDLVLARLSAIITDNIRGIDIPGRFGGDEFLIILPGTDSNGARTVAEKIRAIAAADEITMNDGRTVKYTISLGIATMGPDIDSFETLMRRADEKLYESKKNGRNRISR